MELQLRLFYLDLDLDMDLDLDEDEDEDKRTEKGVRRHFGVRTLCVGTEAFELCLLSLRELRPQASPIGRQRRVGVLLRLIGEVCHLEAGLEALAHLSA